MRFLSSGEWRDLLSEQVESYLSRFVCLYKCTVSVGGSSVVYNGSLGISPLSAVQYLNLNSCSAISQLCSCFLMYCNNYQIMVVSRLTSLPTRTRERSCFIRERLALPSSNRIKFWNVLFYFTVKVLRFGRNKSFPRLLV